jgi:hypothetical protein
MDAEKLSVSPTLSSVVFKSLCNLLSVCLHLPLEKYTSLLYMNFFRTKFLSFLFTYLYGTPEGDENNLTGDWAGTVIRSLGKE